MEKRLIKLRIQAFIITFIAYTAFHMARKPTSIVKSVLHPQNSDGSSGYNHINNKIYIQIHYNNHYDHQQSFNSLYYFL